MVGRHLVDSQKIAVRYIGQESANSRSIYRSRFLSVCMVFSPLSIALKKKLDQDYWNMNRLPPFTRGDSRKNSHFWTFLVSFWSKLLKIKHETMPFFAIASRFVTFFGTGMPKSLNQSLQTFLLFFFAFPFSLVFVILLPLLTASWLRTASCQSVQEFSRKHHPKGKFLPSDEEGNFSSVFKFINLFCIYLKLNITLLWVSLPVCFLCLQQVFYYSNRCLFHVNAW